MDVHADGMIVKNLSNGEMGNSTGVIVKSVTRQRQAPHDVIASGPG